MKKQKKMKWIAVALTVAVCTLCMTLSVSADGATDAIHSFNDIVAEIVSAVGGLATLIGLVILAASISSHDTTQRVTGGLTLASGLIVAFAPMLVKTIGVAL